jgi:protein SCO1/2
MKAGGAAAHASDGLRRAAFALLIVACAPGLAAEEGNGALDPRMALNASQAVVGKPVGDYLLYEVDGRPVRIAQYRGKPLLVSFVYTGCRQVCPAATQFLARATRDAEAALGRDSFNVATIGFNLPFDNPAAMRVFARQQQVDAPSWHFLSPDPASLAGLQRDLGFSAVATPKGFDHITQLTLIDGQGRVFRQVYGEDFEPRLLIDPLKQLLTGAEVPPQDLDGLLRRVRLLCTVYDPLTGTYRFNYGVVIEIVVGGSMLVATLGALLWEWRRARRSGHDF